MQFDLGSNSANFAIEPKRVLKDEEDYDQDFLDAFKAEIVELIKYFINRGADREDYL